MLWASLFNADVHFGVANIDYMGVSVAPSPVLHFWSLNDEEKFYLVWPAVLAVVAWAASRRRRAHWAPTATRPPLRALAFLALLLIGALSLLWSQHQVAVHDAAGYYAAPSRAFELAAGGLLAIASPLLVRLPPPVRVAGAIVGFLTIAFCMLTFTSMTPFPGYHALPVVIGSVLVIAGHPAGVVARGLSTGWVRWVGRVSYSLYLWHWPVFVLAAAAAGGVLTPMQDVACVVASFVLAWLSYHLVERPPQRSGWLRPTRNALVFGLVAILTTAAAAVALGHRSTAVVAASDERAARGITHVAVKDTSLLWIGDSITTRGAGPLRAALHAAGWDYTIDGLGGRPLVSGKRATWNPGCNGAARCGGDLVLAGAKVPGTVVVALGSNAMELVQVRVHAPTATDSGLRRKVDARGRWVVSGQDSPAQIAAQVATLVRMVPPTSTLYFVGLWLDDSHWGNVTWRQSNAAIRRTVAQFPNAHFLDWGAYVDAHHVPYTADGSHPQPGRHGHPGSVAGVAGPLTARSNSARTPSSRTGRSS